MQLRTIQDWIVRRQLLGTEGVADVASFGGDLKQYEVAVNPSQLKSMGVTMTEVLMHYKKQSKHWWRLYRKRSECSFYQNRRINGKNYRY